MIYGPKSKAQKQWAGTEEDESAAGGSLKQKKKVKIKITTRKCHKLLFFWGGWGEIYRGTFFPLYKWNGIKKKK